MKTEVNVVCPAANIWAVMQEPYLRGHSDWLLEKHDFFARVFTHHPAPGPKYIVSHPALPWYINKTYDQLISMPPVTVKKMKKLSWVVGNANDLPGHAKRYALLKAVQEDRTLDIELFGRAIQPIDDKWDALAPYQYSLAIENSSSSDYWTEKVADCFLARTIPIYHGCVNLSDYFPKESFIWIDIKDPRACVKKIKKIISQDDLAKRLPALEKARELVLEHYQLFPFIADKIARDNLPQKTKQLFVIPPYQRSLKAKINHRLYKLKKIAHML
ncbi:glycosyltransferase family 10 domain-containing protein [Desulfobacterota bacterium M19]